MENELCTKFNLCVEAVAKAVNGMRTIKFKDGDGWSHDNSYLVMKGCMTDEGLGAYWKAIDNSF